MEKAIWEKDTIKDLLVKSDRAVCRGIVAIWQRQTADEQLGKDVKENNGIGFNGNDSFILSSFAEFYQKYGRLSEKQLDLGRKKMVKYSGQLARIANGEI